MQQTHGTATVRTPLPTVEVVLQGGPVDVPRTLLVPATTAAGYKIKVPRLAGYEHFEKPGDSGNVFVWTYRTRIAE
jgi:hypothetical protein